MAADILNAQGYSNVEPMAPGGGGDGGRDIKFNESDTPGIAFVTLEKNLNAKFKKDLSKQVDAMGVIALFCNVNVTPSMKLAFAKDAIAKGFRLLVFDLERLRSLFDSSLKEIRRHYLQLDDEVAAKLRSEVGKLLKYPDAIPDDLKPPTTLEQILMDKQPRRLFDLLMRYEESDVVEVPAIGNALSSHLQLYYRFRQEVMRFENDLWARIASIIGDRFNSRAIWRMYFDYAIPRFYGVTKDAILQWGNSLNCGVTWEDTERVFTLLSNEQALTSQVAELNELLARIGQNLSSFITPDNTA